MRPIIITELLTTTNGKVSTKYRADNLHGNSPILNNGTALFNMSDNEGYRLKVTKDESDIEGKSWFVCQEDDFDTYEGKSVVLQYTALFQLNELKNLPVIITDKVKCQDCKATLTFAPSNLFNEYPILNYGYTTTKDEKGALIHIPVTPDVDDETGCNVLFPIENEEFKALIEGKEITVQYVHMKSFEEVTQQEMIVTESLVFRDGKVTLTNNTGSLMGQESLLNFGFGVNHKDETGEINFTVKLSKVSDNQYSLENAAKEDIELVEGKTILVQYTTLVDLDVSFSPQKDTYSFSELGIDPEMLRKAREEAESSASTSDTFQGSVLEVVDEDEDDIVDGEFTEVTE